MSDDVVMARIERGIALVHAGRRHEAQTALAQIWCEIEKGGDPFHLCVIAHFMADVQADPSEELAWDLRALAAAESLSDERVKVHHASMSLAGLLPSLHLNAGDAYRRVADAANARLHLRRAEEASASLGDDAYATTIRGAIRRLADRLDAARDAERA